MRDAKRALFSENRSGIKCIAAANVYWMIDDCYAVGSSEDRCTSNVV